MNERILVTGMSGLIGGAVRERLQSPYQLTALNRSLVPGVTTVQADIADFDAIRPAFENQQTVVHLAASARGSDPWERVRDPKSDRRIQCFRSGPPSRRVEGHLCQQWLDNLRLGAGATISGAGEW